MNWLMIGLIGLALFAGLILLAALAPFTRARGRRDAADDTLITDLLGPLRPPDARIRPAAQARQEAEAPSARPAPTAPSAPPAPPAPGVPLMGEGGWLEDQLAGIKAWSAWMQEQITYWAADPEVDWLETQLAGITASAQWTEEQIASRLAAFRSSSGALRGPGPGLARAQIPALQAAEEPALTRNAHHGRLQPSASRIVTNGHSA